MTTVLNALMKSLIDGGEEPLLPSHGTLFSLSYILILSEDTKLENMCISI